MSLSLAVQFATRATHAPARAQVRRWALAAHALAEAQWRVAAVSGVVTIRYVDEVEARELNGGFRHKDYATNVLTFVSEALVLPKSAHGSAQYAADIAICAPVVAREAKAQKKTVHAHHAHMVIHGMLHAMGFDHEQDDEAELMEAIEIRVLQRFRINDPYA